jgi:hypothetical protein
MRRQSHRLPGRIGNPAQWGFRPASTRDDRPANPLLVTLDHRHRASTLVVVIAVLAARTRGKGGYQDKVGRKGEGTAGAANGDNVILNAFPRGFTPRYYRWRRAAQPCGHVSAHVFWRLRVKEKEQ